MTAPVSDDCEMAGTDNWGAKRVCAMPLEVVRTYTLSGAGFGLAGTDCIVTFEKVRCLAGHSYDREISSVELERSDNES